MKTIKFRGKRLIDGKWIFGCLAGYSIMVLNAPIEKKVIFENIVNFATDNFGFVVNDCAVDPGTIGQFTGLFDANGKEIYEGDIIRLDFDTCSTIEIVAFKDGRFVTIDPQKPYRDEALCVFVKYASVIGNILDTPKLLKGGCHE